MTVEFEELRERALGPGGGRFDFQRRFALEALPRLIRVPTGLGKTATVVLGWIWRRFHADETTRRATPRRLVYCLPMRTLVEQTEDSVCTWLDRLGLQEEVSVHVLMGGEDATDWDLYPERDAILIGTQDMLLSRALNRGYAMSRYRWPMPYGLLNNDCLWVFDEVQLMDVGVATSAQLEGLRLALQGGEPTVQSVWMSATLDERWLKTVDFPTSALGERLELNEQDFADGYINRLWTAPKRLSPAEVRVDEPAGLADTIIGAHRPGTKTLAVFNTVRRAVEVFESLKKKRITPDPVLIHSRFRPEDRARNLRALLERKDVIAVTTQVVEAGVDVSVATLLTEVAPWASLVQRLGRCNRRGEIDDARAIWFDAGEIGDDAKQTAPYGPQALREAREVLRKCDNASLESLEAIQSDMPLEPAHVIRRRDLIDLFDTTPDLAGNDIDISRFIRSGNEHDVQVFWRAFEGPPTSETGAPRREELCSAPCNDVREFQRKNRSDVWRWDGLAEQWRKAEDREIYPGQTYLIRAAAGGYSPETGWSPKSGPVAPLREGGAPPAGLSSDFEDGPWLSIADHTDDVVRELETILEKLDLGDDEAEALREAARWHDWGKAHCEFQAAVKEDGRPEGWQGRLDVAKAPRSFWSRYKRRGFRHELASALAMLESGKPDLSAYLAAAHHGKVRLSIRSLPNEKRPGEPGRLYARGVWHGDALRASIWAAKCRRRRPCCRSSTCCWAGRRMDGRSWAERMLRVRDERGPFRLAYLEALLRAADSRASRAEAAQAGENGDE